MVTDAGRRELEHLRAEREDYLRGVPAGRTASDLAMSTRPHMLPLVTGPSRVVDADASC